MYNLKDNKLGMTLIEMVISLVILGILMSSTMGLIISSNNIFISTSTAALDRMVGNYVFQTIEKSTRYATHMKIADHTNTPDNDYKQSFSLGDIQNAGTEQESGKLYVKTENANEAINIYGDGFYGNRTVQYKFEKVPNSDRHVHITVKVFRNDKLRYKREGTVKCVNLGLLVTDVQSNVIDDSAVTNPNGVNQTIYFSTNELLISGGEDAWSLEYKVQDYMEGYNEILDEYTAKLNEAQKPLKDFVTQPNNSNNRLSAETYSTLVNQRNTAFFGVSSINNFNSTISGKNYDINKTYQQNLALAGDSETNNLRYQYQCKIYNFLGYSPLATYQYDDKDTGVPSMLTVKDGNTKYPNPYYGVVVTKEQLYAGFLFKYYATDPSVGVKITDFPKFEDSKTFFKGSIFANDGFDEEMVILSLFKESQEKGIVGDTSKPIAEVRSSDTVYLVHNRNITYTKPWVTWSGMADRFGKNAASDGAVLSVTDEAAEGETAITHNYKRAYSVRSSDGGYTYDYMKYKLNEELEGEEFLASISIYNSMRDRDDFTGFETQTTCEIVDDKLTPFPITEYATKVNSGYPGSAALSGTRICFKATKDIEAGWYYYTEGTYGRYVYANHIFYLAAPEGADNPTDSSIAVKKDSYIELYSSKYSIESENSSGYRYQQAKHTASDGNVTKTTSTVPLYTLNSHNYNDFMLYSVDRGYWYISPKRGLLNKIINNNAERSVEWQNWANGTYSKITGDATTAVQSNKVDVLTQYNANKSLGNMTSNTFSGNVEGRRSYQNAFIVYNKNRSTWYYLPAQSTRISSYLSNRSWYSSGDTPVVINLDDYSSPDVLFSDIENRKLRSRAFFNLLDTTKDAVWVALPSTAASLLE